MSIPGNLIQALQFHKHESWEKTDDVYARSAFE